ncbi:hypothetical protein CKO32_03150 [Afifella marina DSM 2698]|nr:hypothetical protein [Afifella marina DSM 2698]MBK1625551.1 hypothetical protein [Afifella marina]MBK5917374.1 hypothetical protein [Afifella marina]RAI23328.1 hypothetical protein CH311_00065 [Afifella marina DSM 2698]
MLCVATILYRRITGDLTLKMKGFDFILEELAYEEIGIEEIDTNIDRIKEYAAHRNRLKNLPAAELLAEKSKMYRGFLEAFPRLESLQEKMAEEGKSATDILDMLEDLKGRRDS